MNPVSEFEKYKKADHQIFRVADHTPESCHFVDKCQNYNLNIRKGVRLMHKNYFFPGEDALSLKMICWQMSRSKLTKGNIALAL